MAKSRRKNVKGDSMLEFLIMLWLIIALIKEIKDEIVYFKRKKRGETKQEDIDKFLLY